MNGDASETFLEMIRTLSKNIREDFNRGIIACAHGQSHINAYLSTHKCKIVGIEFNWPEEWNFGLPLLKRGDCPRFDNGEITQPIIIFREKTHLDSYFNKGRRTGRCAKIIKAWKRLVNAVKWYLYIS